MAYPTFGAVSDFESRAGVRRRYVVPAIPVPPGLTPAQERAIRADRDYGVFIRSLSDADRTAIAFGDYEQLEGFKFSKLVKKIGKVLSTPAKIIGTVTGIIPLASAIGIRPKALGFKAASAQRQYRKIGQITRIAGAAALAVAGGIAFGPAIVGAVGKAGSVVWGGLKFVGGKLLAAPAALLKILGAKGIDPATAKPEEILKAGQEAGYQFPTSAPIVDGAPMSTGAAAADVAPGAGGDEEPAVAVQPKEKNYVPLVIGGLAVAGALALAMRKKGGR